MARLKDVDLVVPPSHPTEADWRAIREFLAKLREGADFPRRAQAAKRRAKRRAKRNEKPLSPGPVGA